MAVPGGTLASAGERVRTGGLRTINCTADEATLPPKISVAAALSKYVPALRLLNTRLKGGLVLMATRLVAEPSWLRKNRTCAMIPFAVESTLAVTFAGA